MSRNHGFPPIIDASIEVLLLGSFPSVASLGQNQYYAHPQNQFWRLVGAVIGEPLPALSYDARLATLLKHRIGLWDVIGACVRPGSLDSNIRDIEGNDFARVLKTAKKLKRVCFNGKTAGRWQPAFSELGYETLVLPSSSPAHAALNFEQKLVQWRKMLKARPI